MNIKYIKLLLIMSKTNYNIFRSVYNNCLTPTKIYTRESEDVYKLNFFNSSSKPNDKKIISELKPIQSIETSELFRSVEKVKKFLPDIVNLINITENRKTEAKLFKRLEHIEYEKSFKNELKLITEKREKIKKILSEKREKLQNLEKELSDIELTLKVFSNIRKNPLIFKNEVKKKAGQRFSIKQLSTPEFHIISNTNNNNDTNKNNNNESKINKIKNFVFSNKFKNLINQRKSCIIKTDKKIFNNNINTHNNAKNFDTNIPLDNSKLNVGEQIVKMQKNFSQIKFEKKQLLIEIKKYEKEKEELKNKKEKIIEHLYLYYLDILKEGNDTRNEGLVWIVREILHLGKIVLISYFPKYLSEPEILYIFKQAKLKLLLEEYENQIQKLRNELIELNLLKKSNQENIKINEINIKDYKYKENRNNKNKIRFKKELSDYSLKNKPLLLDQKISPLNNLINNNNEYSKFNSTARTAFSSSNNDNNFNSTNISFNINSNDNNNYNLNNNNLNDKNNEIKININENNNIWPKSSKLSRNKINYINKDLKISRKLLEMNSTKLDLSNINSIPNRLTLTEVKEFLNSSKPIINEKNYGKIEYYFILNQKILNIKKMLSMIKKKEMKRIFEEYLKKGFDKKFMNEKETILSALIGEDNVLQELNRQKKEIKLYLKTINKNG